MAGVVYIIIGVLLQYLTYSFFAITSSYLHGCWSLCGYIYNINVHHVCY